MKYAHIVSGVVNDAVQVDPFGIFSHDYAAQFVVAPDAVQPGWLSDGVNFSAPVVVPSSLVPDSVTMRQARLALLGAGMLASVNSAIAGMTGMQGDAARIEWEFSSEVKRHDPLVMALGPTLGLTAAQLDGLFIAASVL